MLRKVGLKFSGKILKLIILHKKTIVFCVHSYLLQGLSQVIVETLEHFISSQHLKNKDTSTKK
jgi:hypothetical protein